MYIRFYRKDLEALRNHQGKWEHDRDVFNLHTIEDAVAYAQEEMRGKGGMKAAIYKDNGLFVQNEYGMSLVLPMKERENGN